MSAAAKKAEAVGRNRRLSLTSATANKLPEGGLASLDLGPQAGGALQEAAGGYRFAALSQAGHEPDGLKKTNQDAYIAIPNIMGGKGGAIFGVFDGHGAVGHQVSGFIREYFPKALPAAKLAKDKVDQKSCVRVMEECFATLNKELNKQDIDCSLSGTTAVATLIKDGVAYCSNLGDSRCVIGRISGGRMTAVDLSDDQKPERKDECERVQRAGGRCEPLMDMGEPIGPGRVWLKHMMLPELAMTRSFGDLVAESVGVIPEPETKVHEIQPQDCFMILASDGVWEFITSEQAVAMIEKCATPEEACKLLVEASSQHWRDEEDVMDDITAVVVFLNNPNAK